MKRLTDIFQLENVKYIMIGTRITEIKEYKGLDYPRHNGDYDVLETNYGSYSKHFLLGETPEFKNNRVFLVSKEENPEYYLWTYLVQW